MAGNGARSPGAEETTEGRQSGITRMLKACRNEKAAPELLMHQTELVRALCNAIEAQEDDLTEWQDSREEVQTGRLKAAIFWREIHRAKYLLRSYLRTRLVKIETNAMAYAMSEEHYERMSESEQEFLTKYINATERLMHDSVLRGLPAQYQSLVSQIGDDGSSSSFDMIPSPDLKQPVFVLALNDIDEVEIGEGTESDVIELNRGSIYVIQYRQVKHLLQQGDIELL